jgi:hypothetical protein
VAFAVSSAVMGAGAGAEAAGAASGPTAVQSPNGPSVKLIFATGGETGAVTFTGLLGEKIHVDTSGGTFAANCDLQVTLLKLNGTPLSGPVCGGQSGTTTTVALPRDGTYTVRAVAGAAATGSVRVGVKRTGPIASITPEARPLTVAVTSPSQQRRFGFVAGAGAVYTVNATNGSLPGCSAYRISILRPDLSVLASGEACGAGVFIDRTAIPSNGVYRVEVLNLGGGTGSVDLALYKITDQTGVANLDGTPINVKIKQPGQNARFTFSGTSGRKVSVAASASTFVGCDALVLRLVRPDGSQVTESGTCGSAALIDATVLDVTGTWTAVFDPVGGSPGTAIVAVYDVVDQTGPITLDGTAVVFSSTVPGKNAAVTFSGTSGQTVSVNTTGGTFPGCNAYELRLLRPDGSILGSAPGCGSSAFLEPKTLDMTGTWTAQVDPDGAATGSVTMHAYKVVDQKGKIALDGTAVNFTSTVPGKNLRATFSGALGQRVSVNATGGTFTGCDAYGLRLLRPNGSTFASIGTCGSSVLLDAVSLDVAGTWTVLVDPVGATTGGVTVQAYTVVDQTGSISPGGAAQPVSTSVPGENARFTFGGTSGDSRTVTVGSSTFPGCFAFHVSLVRPDGSVRSTVGGCAAGVTLGPALLDATGSWTVLFDPVGPSTGTATVTLT